MTKQSVYYRIRKGDLYLCGVLHRCAPYWGKEWAASETTSEDQAIDWQTEHGGEIEEVEP